MLPAAVGNVVADIDVAVDTLQAGFGAKVVHSIEDYQIVVAAAVFEPWNYSLLAVQFAVVSSAAVEKDDISDFAGLDVAEKDAAVGEVVVAQIVVCSVAFEQTVADLEVLVAHSVAGREVMVEQFVAVVDAV